MRRLLHCILALSALTSTAPISAQFHGDGTQLTDIAFHYGPIDHVPPLQTDMPLDCLLGYIVADSAGRTQTEAVIRSYLETIDMDTLRQIARRHYAVIDYSPELFKRYQVFAPDARPDGPYRSYPNDIAAALISRIFGSISEFGLPYAYLISTHYAFRVRIDDVVVGVDTTFGQQVPWVNVAANVIDTIKGQHRPITCSYPSETRTSSSASCITFGYRFNRRTGGGFFDDMPNPQGQLAPPVEGDEYYVFLRQNAYFANVEIMQPISVLDRTGGLFHVVDGHVSDPDNVWGLGTAPSVSAFDGQMAKLTQEIKNWRLP